MRMSSGTDSEPSSRFRLNSVANQTESFAKRDGNKPFFAYRSCIHSALKPLHLESKVKWRDHRGKWKIRSESVGGSSKKKGRTQIRAVGPSSLWNDGVCNVLIKGGRDKRQRDKKKGVKCRKEAKLDKWKDWGRREWGKINGDTQKMIQRVMNAGKETERQVANIFT